MNHHHQNTKWLQHCSNYLTVHIKRKSRRDTRVNSVNNALTAVPMFCRWRKRWVRWTFSWSWIFISPKQSSSRFFELFGNVCVYVWVWERERERKCSTSPCTAFMQEWKCKLGMNTGYYVLWLTAISLSTWSQCLCSQYTIAVCLLGTRRRRNGCFALANMAKGAIFLRVLLLYRPAAVH